MLAPEEPTQQSEPSQGGVDDSEQGTLPTRPQPAPRVFRNLSRASRTVPDSATASLVEDVSTPPASSNSRCPFGRRPRVTPPTQAELDALPVDKRQELFDARRQRPWQALTSLGVLFGVLFTAAGLVYTAKTWQTGQETLASSVQGQITDRYTKAVEQLGSKTLEIRLGAIYALERIAADSPRDARTIQNVMAAFVRNRDFCDEGPKVCPAKMRSETSGVLDIDETHRTLDIDVRAALDLAISLTATTVRGADLSASDFPQVNLGFAWLSSVNLVRANLRGAYLEGAILQGANLGGADMRDATLSGVNFSNADLSGADLSKASLTGVDLRGASLGGANLTGAGLSDLALDGTKLRGVQMAGIRLVGEDMSGLDMTFADLAGASLVDVDLAGATLVRANLHGAQLSHVSLDGADLRGADLRGVTGLTTDEIKKVAIVDGSTKF